MKPIYVTEEEYRTIVESLPYIGADDSYSNRVADIIKHRVEEEEL